MKDPEVYIRPVKYGPIRIYVGGEVRRPGYYTLSRPQSVNLDLTTSIEQESTSISGGTSSTTLFPTVFDALKTAQGVTPFSDLRQVEVVRKTALSAGSERIRTSRNIWSLISEEDESQNIRLFDGDVIKVAKSSAPIKEQLLKAGQ